MTRDEIIAVIDDQLNSGIDNPESIAFAIIQRKAELIAGDDTFAEAMALRDAFIRVQDAFEEEYAVLMGDEGNTYTAP